MSTSVAISSNFITIVFKHGSPGPQWLQVLSFKTHEIILAMYPLILLRCFTLVSSHCRPFPFLTVGHTHCEKDLLVSNV